MSKIIIGKCMFIRGIDKIMILFVRVTYPPYLLSD